jgi:hypothetical protein
MTETNLDANDIVYLRAASRAGAEGTPIFFDEVPRVVKLRDAGLLIRLESKPGRVYGSAVITADGTAVVAKIDAQDRERMRELELEVSRLNSKVYDLETELELQKSATLALARA